MSPCVCPPPGKALTGPRAPAVCVTSLSPELACAACMPWQGPAGDLCSGSDHSHWPPPPRVSLQLLLLDHTAGVSRHCAALGALADPCMSLSFRDPPLQAGYTQSLPLHPTSVRAG